MEYIKIARKSAVIIIILFTWIPFMILFLPTYWILSNTIRNNPLYLIVLFVISISIMQVWLYKQRIKFTNDYLYLPTKPFGLGTKKIKITDIKKISEKIMDVHTYPAYVVTVKCFDSSCYFRANYYSNKDRFFLYNSIYNINNQIEIPRKKY